ncbi:unnamed protein product [Sphagnum troendelagicum]|uniref:Secreted protein n=1 Tax=Sphagnum jensenii TaxID=128206 RepID=A0ABP0WQZ2_9BRYO
MMFGWGCRWIYEMDAAGMMPVSRSCCLLLAAAAAMHRDRRRAFLCNDDQHHAHQARLKSLHAQKIYIFFPGSSTSSLSERSTQVCAASASKFFPAFLLAFFLSVYSPCNLVPGQLSTKEIKTTDVKSCKSNALKHEDEADHTSI